MVCAVARLRSHVTMRRSTTTVSQAKAGEKTHDDRTYRSSVRDEWKSKSAVFQKHTALGVFRIFPQTKALKTQGVKQPASAPDTE